MFKSLGSLIATLALPACAPSDDQHSAESALVQRLLGPEMAQSVELSGDRRPALLVTAGAPSDRELTLEAGDRLRFAVGAPEPADPDAATVEFRLSCVRQANQMTLDQVTGLRTGGRWRDREVRIPEELAGQGRLRFEVTSAGTVAVADPRIVPRRVDRSRLPNLLIYLIDTLRPDHLSCYGASHRTSPRIDALAADGYRFENFYAVAPWTRPTTATLLTGVSPEHHGMGKELPLPEAIETLAEILAAARYSTWAAVSNPQVGVHELGFDQGFHRFVNHEGIRIADDAHRMTASSEQLNRSILPWIEASGDEPFFLYLHSMDPHSPYTPGPGAQGPFGRSYRGPLRSKGLRPTVLRPLSNYLGDAEREYVRGAYDNEILHQDAQLGELLDALEAQGLRNETIVIVVSDHGEEFQEHGNWGHGYRMWEELLRVPFVLWMPEQYRQASNPVPQVIQETVSQLDFLPGLLDLLGLETPGPLAGKSWLPLLQDAPGADTNPLFAIDFQSWKGDEIGAYRSGRYKLLWCNEGRQTLIERLFDLEADPKEQHDLSQTQPVRLDRMRRLRDRHQQNSERFALGHDTRQAVQLNAETLRELRELGYVDSGDDEH